MRSVLVALCALAVGCAPPCERVCRKVLFDCELSSERVALDECVDACARQEDQYRAWQNDDLVALARDHRTCVVSSTCDELAAGACYEGYEALFAFDPDKELPTSPAPTGSGAAE